MDGVVGRGTLLAGRYRVVQPIASDLAGATAWTATDQILDRAVRVAILSEGHVPQALDAARRAALVTDQRLIRVLDVGEHEGVAYVISEPVAGPSLAQLVARGPLPADQARALIGEAAAALEAARRRGVHHLALRPSVLHLTPDNQALITGLAVDGALLGRGLGDARSTTRADTVGLVALLYAALTGRWPGTTFDAGLADGPSVPQLPAAPVLNGGPAAPSELVAGVPNDLDTLCAVTLGSHDDGPHSPAELVLELEPWGELRGADLLGAADPLPAPRASTGKPAQPEQPAVHRTSVRSMFTDQTPPSAARPGTPPPAVPQRSTAFGAATAVGASAAAETEHPRPAAITPAGPPRSTAPPPADRAAPASTTTPARDVPALTRALPAPRNEATSAALPAHPQQGARPASLPPRPSFGPVAAPAARGPVPPSTQAPAHPRGFDDLVAAREAIVTRRFDPTRLVLAIVVVGMLFGLFLAFQSLTRPGNTPEPAAEPGASTSATPSASPSAAAESPAPTTAAPPPAGVIAVASGQSLDPPPGGDDNEHPEAVPLAIDGDPTTFWYSRTYNSPTFGMKPGIGYAVNLTAPATVTTVTLQVNGTGGRVEVRSTDPTTPTTGDVLAEGPLSASTVLTLSAPTLTQHLVLWFPELPQTADGRNRLELAEVSLS